MPEADEIVALLDQMADELAWLATAWHVVIALVAVSIARGWRPSPRVALGLPAATTLSVSAAAITYGNPFNA